jgi:hypothetical protein
MLKNQTNHKPKIKKKKKKRADTSSSSEINK